MSASKGGGAMKPNRSGRSSAQRVRSKWLNAAVISMLLSLTLVALQMRAGVGFFLKAEAQGVAPAAGQASPPSAPALALTPWTRGAGPVRETSAISPLAATFVDITPDNEGPYAGQLFFSSSGRHTRFSRDWSSDVCSSDLHRGRRVRSRDGGRPRLDDPDTATLGVHPSVILGCGSWSRSRLLAVSRRPSACPWRSSPTARAPRSRTTAKSCSATGPPAATHLFASGLRSDTASSC